MPQWPVVFCVALAGAVAAQQGEAPNPEPNELQVASTDLEEASPSPDTLPSSEEETSSLEGRQRIDMAITRTELSEGDAILLLPSYSHAFGVGLRLEVGTSYSHVEVDREFLPEASERSVSGWGDTSFSIQYAPSLEITASPWIPDSIGVTGHLTAPTGDVDKGIGNDSWEGRLGLGWSFPFVSDLWLVPAGYYAKTFDESELSTEVHEWGVSLELRWVFDNGVWVGYRPTLVKDLVFDDWVDDHYFVLGRMFPGGFGIAVEYGRLERLDNRAANDTYTGLVNFYYQFGSSLP